MENHWQLKIEKIAHYRENQVDDNLSTLICDDRLTIDEMVLMFLGLHEVAFESLKLLSFLGFV